LQINYYFILSPPHRKAKKVLSKGKGVNVYKKKLSALFGAITFLTIFTLIGCNQSQESPNPIPEKRAPGAPEPTPEK
jgi:hypothetical protein